MFISFLYIRMSQKEPPMRIHIYYVYILTNIGRTVLYTGITNNLSIRLKQHAGTLLDSEKSKAFTHRYGCKYLIYYETYKYVNSAIAREKEIKGWRRLRKLELIRTINPEYKFLNQEFE